MPLLRMTRPENTLYSLLNPPGNSSTSMNYDKSSFAMIEVYQTQRYYPLAGWAKNGRKEYSTTNGVSFDSLPDQEVLPDGWKVLHQHLLSIALFNPSCMCYFHTHYYISCQIISFLITICKLFSG